MPKLQEATVSCLAATLDARPKQSSPINPATELCQTIHRIPLSARCTLEHILIARSCRPCVFFIAANAIKIWRVFIIQLKRSNAQRDYGLIRHMAWEGRVVILNWRQRLSMLISDFIVLTVSHLAIAPAPRKRLWLVACRLCRCKSCGMVKCLSKLIGTWCCVCRLGGFRRLFRVINSIY